MLINVEKSFALLPTCRTKPADRRSISRLAAAVAAMLLLCNVAAAQGLGVTGNLLGLIDGSRVLEVHNVIPGSLASQIGIYRGDNILSINGVAPGDAAFNQQAIARGGGRIAVIVQRNGRQIALGNQGFGGGVVYPGAGIGNPGIGFFTPPGPNNSGGNRYRLTPGQRGPNLQMTLEPSRGFGGVRVTAVVNGGIGDRLQFRAGDVITKVNNIAVNTTNEFSRAYVVDNRRQIALTVLRNGRTGTITINEQSFRRNNAPAARAALTTKLALTTFHDRKRQVTVAGGSKDGLGAQLGIAVRGTRILAINGQPIRTPGDVNRVDEEIAGGKVTRLVINIIRPNGTRDTVSFPAN